MQLMSGHRAVKDGKTKWTVSSKLKPFYLLQMPDISKTEKSERYSCNLDDWVEAINLVVSELWILYIYFVFIYKFYIIKKVNKFNSLRL